MAAINKGNPLILSSNRQKRRLLRHQDGRCAYCNKPISLDTDDPVTMATWDEIVPQSKGGRLVLGNTVLACMPCNHSRGSRDMPLRSGLKPLGPKVEDRIDPFDDDLDNDFFL